MLKARDTRGHLVDPVSGLQKLMEKADGGVHQRHTWTKGVFGEPLQPWDHILNFVRQAVAYHTCVNGSLNVTRENWNVLPKPLWRERNQCALQWARAYARWQSWRRTVGMEQAAGMIVSQPFF